MSRLWVSTILFSAILSATAAARQRNLVLNRPYDYYPKPNYSYCQDEGDIRHLTDGKTFPTSNLWVQKSTVGWAVGIDVPVVILFDLGEEATLSELRFHTASGRDAGVVEVGLRVFVSLDDQNYVLAGELPAPQPNAYCNRYPITLRVPLNLNDTRARYVAVVATPPAPHTFVFVEEIELIGTTPADPTSSLPIQHGLTASGAEGLQQLLAGGNRAINLMLGLTAPVKRHIANWPAQERDAQREDLKVFAQKAKTQSDQYDNLRAQFTEQHRLRAREVYAADTLVWEVVPDDSFTMLSLPETLAPCSSGTIHTVVNALEATALGASNLTDQELPLKISITAGADGAPQMSIRVGWFFVTSNARYVPDALLANDCPQVLASGESKLIWLEAESTGAKPGLYDYDVTVCIGDKAHHIPLKVHVHDVVLSRETPLSTGNWSYLNTGEHPLYQEVRDSMLSHRITNGAATAQGLPKKDAAGKVIRPVQIDFTEIDKFLDFHKDFPQVSWYFSFNHHLDRPHYDWFGPAEWMSDEFKEIFSEWLVEMVEHIKSEGRDYDTFYFQMFDETLDEKVAQLCELVHSVDPKVRLMATIFSSSGDGVNRFVEAGMNIYNYHAPRVEYSAPDGLKMLSSEGRELWFYAAADIIFGVGKETDPLGWSRYLHWTAFHHGATGVHFWNMLQNSHGSPIWGDEPVNTSYFPMVYPNGPGYPIPPIEVTTAEKVIPSRRWEYVRMGIEDYMLLKMAQDKIEDLGTAGNPYRNQLQSIIRDVVTHRNSRTLFRANRRKLVELVETLQKL